MRVFVYGTLKPGHANWRRLLQGRVGRWRAGKIEGRLFDLSLGFPAAVTGSGWVHGYILHLTEPLLALVDDLEGFSPGRPPARNNYNRRQVPGFTPQGAPLGRVHAYFMEPDKVERLGGTELPGGVWRPLTE
ncbi:gamma-glutamylcyclotransferase family protein [Thiohalorhabdus sp. Cl-TMA]|uniref:Gamma-glutamylcyclotransferase n=1 Tax=Thiohalorhabdus methylotrophus TaxID=3242694 RepID=A0ABV4TU22_9GAMM